MLIRLTKILISLIVRGWDFTAESVCRLFGKQLFGKCVVLNYHSVEKDQIEKFGHQLDVIKKNSGIIPLDKSSPLEEGKRYVAITFDDGFVDVIENALPELSKRGIPVTIFVPTGYLGRDADWFRKDGDKGKKKVMDAEQLRDLTGNPMISFGSHCITHSSLLLMTENEAKEEIIRSKRELEEILGENVIFLSYPHGEFTKTHVELARVAGYKRGFSIEPTVMRLTSDEFVIGRVSANTDDLDLEFHLKITGAYRWLPFASSLKRLVLPAYIE